MHFSAKRVLAIACRPSVCNMGIFRGGGGNRPPKLPFYHDEGSTGGTSLAALHWIQKPDDSTSFSSVNELKEIAEVVVLTDISAAFLSCVLCVHIATGLAKTATPQYSTHNPAS